MKTIDLLKYKEIVRKLIKKSKERKVVHNSAPNTEEKGHNLKR